MINAANSKCTVNVLTTRSEKHYEFYQGIINYKKKLKYTIKYSNVSYKSLIDIEPLSSTLRASNRLHPSKPNEKVKNLTLTSILP